MPRPRAWTRAFPFVCLLTAAACAGPPTRELDQAQGAIDTARAAGAAEFATAELAAAENALKRAHEAAAQRDFRQSLSLSIDAKERARDAARSTAERMAEFKSEADLILQSATLAIAQARARLTSPQFARPAARLARRTQALDAADLSLQEARAAAERREYAAARAGAERALAQVREALEPAEAAGDGRPPRAGRPSRP